jgi:hypothetical protein
MSDCSPKWTGSARSMRRSRKAYVSYRRKKQFAMIGPATRTQVEVGLNMKDAEPTDRLVQLPPGQMCNYKLRLAIRRQSTPS